MFPQYGASKNDIRFYDVARFVRELTRIRAYFALIRSKNTAKLDWLEILWPQPSGKVERITELPIDRYITIVEAQENGSDRVLQRSCSSSLRSPARDAIHLVIYGQNRFRPTAR